MKTIFKPNLPQKSAKDAKQKNPLRFLCLFAAKFE